MDNSIPTDGSVATGDAAPPGTSTAPTASTDTRPPIVPVVAAFWLITIVAGLRSLVLHDTKPGMTVAAPVVWPGDATLTRVNDRMTLVMVVHPSCPCTRASLGELEVLMSRFRNRLTAYVLFAAPEPKDLDSSEARSWTVASAIPGVQCVRDPGGQVSKLFGAETSGYTLLYASDGTLRFSGGITISRGHHGDNDGTRSIGSILSAAWPDAPSADPARPRIPVLVTPVYGCSLKERN